MKPWAELMYFLERGNDRSILLLTLHISILKIFTTKQNVEIKYGQKENVCTLGILWFNVILRILCKQCWQKIEDHDRCQIPHHPHRSLGRVKVWSAKVRYMQHTGTQPIFHTFWLKPDRAMALARSGIRLEKMQYIYETFSLWIIQG